MPWASVATPEVLAHGWRVGDLSLLQKPIQFRLDKAWKHAQSSDNRLFVIHISRQVGKSYYALMKCVEKCLQTPGARCVCVAHVEKRLQEYLKPIITQVLESCPRDICPKYVNESLQFQNGSEILLASDANKAFFSQRGQKYHLIVLDEFAFYKSPKELLWSVLYPTTKETNGKILITTTSPESPAHYFNELVLMAQAVGWYFKATIYDDETSSPEEIESLRKGCLDEEAWLREFMCVLGVANRAKLIIPDFQEDFVKELDEATPSFPYYLTHEAMDFGTSDKTLVLFAKYIHDQEVVYIQDELKLEGSEVTTDRLSKDIKDKEDAIWKGEQIYRRIADTDNAIARQTLSSLYGQHFVPVKKKQLKEMVDKVRRWMKGGRIVIHPRCKLLIATLKGGLWADDSRKEFARTELLGHCDAIAALCYLMRHMDDVTDPVPAFVDVKRRKTIISPKAQKILEDKQHPWKRQIENNFERMLGENEDEGIL